MKENRTKLSIKVIIEESTKAIEDSNRVLNDCSFGYITVDQIDIFIPDYSIMNMRHVLVFYPYTIIDKILRHMQRKKKKIFYGQCQKLYGSISILSKQKSQDKERLEYLNYIERVLERSIQYLEAD